MTTLREAIEQTVAILGPEAPLCSGCVEEWTEALRILNDALAEQPAKTVEPVAWCHLQYNEDGTYFADCLQYYPDSYGNTPLYAAPQPAKREPLTREQAMEIVQSNPDTMTAIRMTELAHGIGEQE